MTSLTSIRSEVIPSSKPSAKVREREDSLPHHNLLKKAPAGAAAP